MSRQSLRVPRVRESKEAAELRAAFQTWVAEHGMIWFENDCRLAEAIAAVLNIDIRWNADSHGKSAW